MTIPTEAGWYVARMVTWPIDAEWAVVRVAHTGRDLSVWQAADQRPWAVSAWEWRCRLYPSLFDNPELGTGSIGVGPVR